MKQEQKRSVNPTEQSEWGNLPNVSTTLDMTTIFVSFIFLILCPIKLGGSYLFMQDFTANVKKVSCVCAE
jgi:hypothetical protein